MIINKKTIQNDRNRVQWHKPVMSVISTGLSFTKDAAMILGAPCGISFQKENGTLILRKDDSDSAFVIKERISSDNQPSWQIGSRPLKRLIESFYERRPVRFEIVPMGDNIFNLKLMKQ